MSNDAVLDQTIDSIAELERRALSEASHHQRRIERVTLAIGRPRMLYLAAACIAGWIVVNLALLGAGRPALDGPPFPWLQTVLSIASVLTTLIVLVTANRGDLLDERRDRLTLQIALLTDRKTAKIIALLEELRTDMPTVRDRHDAEATELSLATDPHAVTAELDKRTSSSGEPLN